MKQNEEIRRCLLELVSGLSDEQLNEHPEEGSWSLAQVMGHLVLMEQAAAQGIHQTLESDQWKSVSEKPIHLAVNRSVKVEAPPYLVPPAEFITKEELIHKLSASTSALNQIFHYADEKSLQGKSMVHPIFGSLSLKQWQEFIGLHEKRHIAQMEELCRKLEPKPE